MINYNEKHYNHNERVTLKKNQSIANRSRIIRNI